MPGTFTAAGIARKESMKILENGTILKTGRGLDVTALKMAEFHAENVIESSIPKCNLERPAHER